jgi:hypothetical protein
VSGGASGPVVLNTAEGLAGAASPSRDLLIRHIFSDDALAAHLQAEAAKAADGFADQTAFLHFCVNAMTAFYQRSGDAAGGEQATAEVQAYIEDVNAMATLFAKDGKPNPDAVFWPDPTRGGQRLEDVQPVAREYAFIDQSTAIGSAGSCFAIEIANNLRARGFNYICKETTFDAETGVVVMGSDPAQPAVQYSCRWGILFNTPSFTQIVENAFGVRPLPEILVKLEEGGRETYIDPFREAVTFPSPEAYRIERERHLANTRAVFEEAEVFVVTLGLNEAWRYIPEDVYISRNPRNSALAGLLEHRRLTVQENIDYLQRFIDVVRSHNPNLKLIVTVSPVPFLATGQADEYHVVTANTHSKAVLRVAAQEIVERNTDVYYFPSYEVVTVCSPEIWTEDQRHIHRDAIGRVMGTFDRMFLTRAAKTLARLG